MKFDTYDKKEIQKIKIRIKSIGNFKELKSNAVGQKKLSTVDFLRPFYLK